MIATQEKNISDAGYAGNSLIVVVARGKSNGPRKHLPHRRRGESGLITKENSQP